MTNGAGQGCIRTADGRGGVNAPPGPPPLDPDFIVGENDLYKRKY